MTKFALIPKSEGDPYFDRVKEGCMDAAKEIGIECVYRGPESYEGAVKKQNDIIYEMISSREVDGIAISVVHSSRIKEAIDKAVDANIPVVTFDSDSADSKRSLYIGTNNTRFGENLAKVLLQINPLGGQYGIISEKGQPNLVERSNGIQVRLKDKYLKKKWTLLSESDSQHDTEIALQDMWTFADLGATAIISCCGWPMYNKTGWKRFTREHSEITLVIGDGNSDQLDLLSQGYNGGLVGQLPYQMGAVAMKKLLEIKEGKSDGQEFSSTNILQHLQVPLDISSIPIEPNFIGKLSILGYFLFSLVAALSFGCGIWVWLHRTHPVIKASQPEFLLGLCLGVLIMASSIIPLSIDDEYYSDATASKFCISFWWLFCTGFTVSFSMLFSKTWRVNKIFKSASKLKRIKVMPKDVIVPFAILMTANIIVLVCWSIIAPQKYIRQAHDGTDDWNRIISTYGTCAAPEGMPYVVLLIVLNSCVLLTANFQAFRARHIKTKYSEGRYITWTVGFALQAFLIGGPVAAMSITDPRLFYVVTTLLIGLLCMVILCFIFIPKVRKKNNEDKETRKAPEVKPKVIRNNFSKKDITISKL
mmetsp:Transcript_41833/g.82009  ORF Transcript_41833/g.82009 Transcript_41833/m.82009 type:complete len:590 (-) Transcript_41833:205-1974(-)|eukprot:CAMPEP_0194328980 /NCGR_PEP_ID=MMETSP0171-20130528/46605_1 /TAXON_ID=218684 /ORGANISM="Corethron pennatum, Strain L29A3" /LENGTH=589 /DNA_ID=CAMNT_0039089537 /DNA_START=36 /DNA_END=1805 /DNA_ORIENTATION=+